MPAIRRKNACAAAPLPPFRPASACLRAAPGRRDSGAAGLMRQARLRGDDVRVVIITNGDGFRISAAQEFRELSVPPKDFVRYAYLRQGEARTALGVLGIPADHVHFLGYPDRGLMPMWTSHWTPNSRSSPPTPWRTIRPYTDAPTPECALLRRGPAGRHQAADAGRAADRYLCDASKRRPSRPRRRQRLCPHGFGAAPGVRGCPGHRRRICTTIWSTGATGRPRRDCTRTLRLLPPGPMAALDTHWTAAAAFASATRKKSTRPSSATTARSSCPAVSCIRLPARTNCSARWLGQSDAGPCPGSRRPLPYGRQSRGLGGPDARCP